MTEEIREDNNCIVKAFENNPISIITEEKDNKKLYCFKASDICKALNIVNIRTSIMNFDGDEVVVRSTYDTLKRKQDTLFLTSQGVYRLLYSSKKEIAKKFRKWAGNILDDIIFNESIELKRQLEEKDKKIKLLEHKPETHGFNMRKCGFIYLINDLSKPGHYKIGMANNTERRLRNLNTSSSEKSLRLHFEIETYDIESVERSIHFIMQPYNIKGRREWFYLSDDYQIKYAMYVMNKVKSFYDEFNFSNYRDLVTKTENNVSQINYNLIEEIKQDVKEEIKQDIKETNVFKLTGQMVTNKTGNYKGVSWNNEKKKWHVALKHNYKNIFLGYYDTEIDGAKVYNEYALYINETENTNYLLNNIPNFITKPRDVLTDNKNEFLEKKTSKFVGVDYIKTRQHYKAAIKYNKKTYTLGEDEDEIECAKLYNQQALYYNNTYNTKYILNDIPDYITIPKDVHTENKNKYIKNKSSKYHGVIFSKQAKKYKALLTFNKKQIYLGTFVNEIDAAKAYNQRALELNKELNKNIYIINDLISID